MGKRNKEDSNFIKQFRTGRPGKFTTSWKMNAVFSRAIIALAALALNVNQHASAASVLTYHNDNSPDRREHP